MRNVAIFFAVILIMGVSLQNLLAGAPEGEEWDIDNYGKIVVQVIDPETNKPVKKKFGVAIFEYKAKEPLKAVYYVEETDEKGYWSKEVEAKTYEFGITPPPLSKYCFGTKADLITVKRGQITKIVQKAEIGGSLRVVLVDPAGKKIDVKQFFLAERLLALRTHWNSSEKDTLNDSEMTFFNAPPGICSAELSSDFSGVGYKKVEDILIEKGKRTDYNFVIDTTTGIEGRLIDKKGNPLEKVCVYLYSEDDKTSGNVTDKNGNYRVIGLKEGIYELKYALPCIEAKYDDSEFIIVVISKGKFLKKNFTVDREKLLRK
ncbi:MAG: carboxypeptidase regulatory-like domain-containing protein [bacterium]|nr:carboxypeptidase regulatory-like domain-containing protein [bacterium]